MTKLIVALVAASFATSAIAGTSEKADGRSRLHEHGHPEKKHPSDSYRDHGDHERFHGIWHPAGKPMLLAAKEARHAANAPSHSVYTPPNYVSESMVVYSRDPVIYLSPVTPSLSYANPPTYWWYYCAQPVGYYPYVKHCRTEWLLVYPRPPG